LSQTERKRRPSGRVTLAEVAHQAGVSPITASRALRGERAVTADLVARVQAAADALGYIPDPAARALASQRSTQVPILVPLLSNALFVDLLEAVHSTLAPHGYQTLIGVTHYQPEQEEQLLRTYLPPRPAGLLLTGFDRTEAARQLLARLAPAAQAPAPQAVDNPPVSAREREILRALARGYTYEEVARLLAIAPSTVQSHVKNIYSKLAVHSKTEAIFEARQLGLL